MTLGIKVQRQRIAILVLIFGLLCGSIFQVNSLPLEGAVNVIQAHQGVSTLTAYQSDMFNVSLVIKNIYDFDVYNTSIKVTIPSEIEFLNSTEPNIDSKIENDTKEFEYDFGKLTVDKSIYLTVTYNVTSSSTTTITMQPVNITWRMENGITDSIVTNSQEIGLRGVRETTEIVSLRPIPSGDIPAHPILSILGYAFPLMIFIISIIYITRIRSRKG